MTSLFLRGRHHPPCRSEDAERVEELVRQLLRIAYGNIIRVNHAFQLSVEAKIQRFISEHVRSEWEKIPSERRKIYEAFVPESERTSESYELWNKSFDEATEDYGFHRRITVDGVTHPRSHRSSRGRWNDWHRWLNRSSGIARCSWRRWT